MTIFHNPYFWIAAWIVIAGIYLVFSRRYSKHTIFTGISIPNKNKKFKVGDIVESNGKYEPVEQAFRLHTRQRVKAVEKGPDYAGGQFVYTDECEHGFYANGLKKVK